MKVGQKIVWHSSSIIKYNEVGIPEIVWYNFYVTRQGSFELERLEEDQGTSKLDCAMGNVERETKMFGIYRYH